MQTLPLLVLLTGMSHYRWDGPANSRVVSCKIDHARIFRPCAAAALVLQYAHVSCSKRMQVVAVLSSFCSASELSCTLLCCASSVLHSLRMQAGRRRPQRAAAQRNSKVDFSKCEVRLQLVLLKLLCARATACEVCWSLACYIPMHVPGKPPYRP